MVVDVLLIFLKLLGAAFGAKIQKTLAHYNI